MKAIYLDMDGTFVDLYGVENWLDYLINEDNFPYLTAKPLVNLSVLARRLNKLQRNGYTIGIVSWLSKNGSEEYNERVTAAKKFWLQKHLPSVHWDEIHIVKYGTPKFSVVEYPDGILFDDEKQNRLDWDKMGMAFNVDNLIEILTYVL